MEPFWTAQWNALCDKRYGQGGYSALTNDEKVWLNVRAIIDSTNNGGLISFFYNSYADTLTDSLEALNVLGAGDVRLQVERVCVLFGDHVPSDGDARNAIINSWPDGDKKRSALLNKIDDYLYDRFPDLEKRLEAFVRKSGLAT
jgi:hypothetical protein